MVVYCIREWLRVYAALAEEEGVAVGMYSIRGNKEWVCTLLAKEGMAVGVYSISGRGRGFWY